MGYRYEDPLFYTKRKRNFRGLIIIVLIILILLIATVLVNAFINRQVQSASVSVTIPSLPSSLQGYRILHISDLHGEMFGNGQEGISATLKNLKYDVVVLSGDMTGPDGNFDSLMALLDLIDENKPIIMIAGDEDPTAIPTKARISNQVKAEYILAAEKRGVIYLDEPYPITVGKTIVWFCPGTIYTDDIATTRHNLLFNLDIVEKMPPSDDTEAQKRALQYKLDQMDRIEEKLLSMKSGDVKICVTHVPYTASQITDLQYNDSAGIRNNATPVSLVLAGHYNNGQCRLPGLGPVYIPAAFGIYDDDRWFPTDSKLSGLNTIRGITQYISPGLGSARIYAPLTWRFFNSPYITVLTLTSKLVSQ